MGRGSVRRRVCLCEAARTSAVHPGPNRESGTRVGRTGPSYEVSLISDDTNGARPHPSKLTCRAVRFVEQPTHAGADFGPVLVELVQRSQVRTRERCLLHGVGTGTRTGRLHHGRRTSSAPRMHAPPGCDEREARGGQVRMRR